MFEITERTIIPIFLLIAAGLISRKLNLLKKGDERVFSLYLYYFAIPSLFIVNISELKINLSILKIVIASIVPVFISILILITIGLIFKIKKSFIFLLIITTIFGSLAFFGIPFVMFAFPGSESEHLSVLTASSISIISVPITITLLEVNKLKNKKILKSIFKVIKRLSLNPLILSILGGVLISIIRINLPQIIKKPLHMLGNSTTVVAFFMLGVFLYGRKYKKLFLAFKLSLLRIVFLPVIAIITINFFELSNLQNTIIVLMHAMPVAVSFFVLSERYSFYKETVSSIILISSISAAIYLNIWLLIVGY